MTANDGYQAIELARHIRPQVVLLDIAMPGMDGYEVAKRLRQDPGADGVRIFAITAFGQDADRARSIEAGMDLHLVKPLDPVFLQSLLGHR